ncbi:UBC-like protein [Dendrothele bispora CBS 962.96]|uniref:UBC-like protein n=1 Tax=Dendrothele bispora (strain CBS 962.96) TaxID=1314807 RepID=A0A4S8N0I1_DENBC|nr:UBC-like protein [Dendrothele bispora CBS 962.96]
MFSPLGPATSKPRTTKSLFGPKTTQQPTHSKTLSQDSVVSQKTRAAISFEYASLRHKSHCPLGIYVVPSAETLLIWDAVLFIHQGRRYYADAILKFRLIFPSNYPERPPNIQFINDVFHPLVSAQGTFNLAPQIRVWRPNQHHVFDVLHFVKAAFKRDVLDKIEESDCYNKEAYRYRESTASFASLATQTASLSQTPSTLYDKDQPPMSNKPSHSMHFSKLKGSTLREERAKYGLKEWEKDSPGGESGKEVP